MPFIAIYNVYSAVLRGIGDSKVLFYAVFVSSVLNIILDLIFVAGFKWGANVAAISSAYRIDSIIMLPIVNVGTAISIFYILFGLSLSFRGYIEGCGHVIISGVAGIITLFVRIIFSYSFVSIFGNMVIAFAEGFSWILFVLIYIIGIIFFAKSYNIKTVR